MRSLRCGAEGRVAAGELLVGPFVAGGEVEEGQHQFSGVAVPLSLRTVPLLVRAVGGHDLRQRYAKHLGRNLCMRGKGNAGRDFILQALSQPWELSYICAHHAASNKSPSLDP